MTKTVTCGKVIASYDVWKLFFVEDPRLVPSKSSRSEDRIEAL